MRERWCWRQTSRSKRNARSRSTERQIAGRPRTLPRWVTGMSVRSGKRNAAAGAATSEVISAAWPRGTELRSKALM